MNRTYVAASERIRQSGLSLVEVLIALALGSFLLLGLVEIFSSVRASYASAEGVSRVQENGRFAMEFLRRDVRHAGHMGCMNEFQYLASYTPADPTNADPARQEGFRLFYHHGIQRDQPLSAASYITRIDTAVEVYDYDDTSPGDPYTLEETPAAVTTAGDFTPALPADLDLLGDVLPGSDVVVVRFFDPEKLLVDGAPDAITGELPALLPPNSQLSRGYFGVTDCKVASLFYSTLDHANATPNPLRVDLVATGLRNTDQRDFFATPPPTSVWWEGQEAYARGSLLYRYTIAVYYVGRGASGEPSLFRKMLAPNGAGFSPAEELVEGIEMMQVVLGVEAASDDPATLGRTRLARLTTYRSASQQHAIPDDPNSPIDESTDEGALRQVRTLRVGLLSRSAARGPGVGAADDAGYNVGEVEVAVPNDSRLRYVYEANLAIRSRVPTRT